MCYYSLLQRVQMSSQVKSPEQLHMQEPQSPGVRIHTPPPQHMDVLTYLEAP